MAEALQSVVPAPGDPKQGNEDTPADSNANDGSTEDENLHHHAQVLAHARSVSTPPATPAITDEIEMDITSTDISEHAPGLYVARAWIRPSGLTQQEMDQTILRLEVDLTLALSKIRAKSHRKPLNEDMVMMAVRMAGYRVRGSIKVKLKPCVWIFCGSKWCQKIVERDVRALSWLGPHKVHVVRKGGPLLAADEEYFTGALDHVHLDHSSHAARSSDDQREHNSGLAEPSSDEQSPDSPSLERRPSTSGDWFLSAQSSRTLTQSSLAVYGSAGVYSYHPTNSVISSTGGYEYQSQNSGTSMYSGYTTYDSASVTSSAVPSYTPGAGSSGGSVSTWSDSKSYSTAASSTPSRHSRQTDVKNTIHRQATPNKVYQLPCELSNLTGCDVVFPVDDDQGWIDHIETHLGGRFPSKLRCWFCSDRYFDACQTSSGDLRLNFISRMEHIRHHLVHEGFRPDQMMKDGHVVQHLRDHDLIDVRTYDNIVNPKKMPPVPSNQAPGNHRLRRTHKNHHRPLRVEEEDDASILNSRIRHGYPNNYQKRQGRSRSLKGKDRAENTEYEQSFASLKLSDYDPHAPRTDYYDPSYPGTYGSSLYVPESTSHGQYVRPKSHTTRTDGSGVAFWGATDVCVHVRFYGLTSLIGLSCISTTWRGHTELSRSTSKMGGAFSITLGGQTSLYSVTSGHGLIRQLLNTARQSGDDSSTDEFSDSSDSEYGYAEESPTIQVESIYSEGKASIDSAVDLSDHTIWTPIDHGIAADFLGIRYPGDTQRDSEPDELHAKDTTSGDIALFPIGSFHRPGLINHYIEPDTLDAKKVTSISEQELDSTIPVLVLLGPEQTVSGTVQPGKFHFSMRGTSIDARQVRLSRDLAPGSSGSWVVHDQTLYGMIVAIFPGECIALMVPAKKMIGDVRKLCPGATDISVAISH